jgi:hypothetical protein
MAFNLENLQVSEMNFNSFCVSLWRQHLSKCTRYVGLSLLFKYFSKLRFPILTKFQGVSTLDKTKKKWCFDNILTDSEIKIVAVQIYYSARLSSPWWLSEEIQFAMIIVQQRVLSSTKSYDFFSQFYVRQRKGSVSCLESEHRCVSQSLSSFHSFQHNKCGSTRTIWNFD